MLDVNQLTRCYGSLRAVDRVSFSIGQGEIVGLLGHNGAGKTTIMKMLSGYLEPDSGSVTMEGISLMESPHDVQAQLGYLPESLPLYPEMVVADYLDYAADLKGLTGEAKLQELRRVIRATDITNKLLAPIATLSRGYKQRVGVAQAILGQPRLLILDEPTNGLDPEQTAHMRELLREVAKSATVILSTHIMQEVDALCSRVLIMRSGQLVVDELLESLRSSHSLLLHSSLGDEAKLLAIEGIARAERLSDAGRYRLHLSDDADKQALSAQVAAQIVSMGEQLYQLQPEIRDLETLFREVNEQHFKQEELGDAA